MRKRDRTRWGGAWAVALIGVGLMAAGGQAAQVLPLLPGTIEGSVNAYTVRAGDSLSRIASAHGVHPVRVRKPSAKVLADGLEREETLFIDQRRVRPRFEPWVSGIVLNVPEAHVYLLDHGRIVRDYPVAVSRSDWAAPLGQTRVTSMSKNPTWHVPKSIQEEMAQQGREVKTRVPPGPENPLGTRWIGFADNTFGFHGTIAPTSIKSYSSHGCVRFFEPHIQDLYGRVTVGTPVRVYYQPVLMAIDRHTVWLSVYPDIYRRNFDYRGAVDALAAMAGVKARLHPEAVARALHLKDGILTDVAQPPAPSKPVVKQSPLAPEQDEAPSQDEAVPTLPFAPTSSD